MGSFVTTLLKNKAKKLHDGYVKFKESKNSGKGKKKEDCDKSGIYKAEPTDELYDKLLLVPEIRRNSSVVISSSSKNSKVSSAIPCSSTEPLSNSQGSSSEIRYTQQSNSSNSSLDSGISKTPPGQKKIKKLQFSSDSDEVYVFEQNTLERGSYQAPCTNEKRMKAQLRKTKVFTAPTAEKVKIINIEFNTTSKNHLIESSDIKSKSKAPCSKILSDNVIKSPKISLNCVRVRESIVSPKTYIEEKPNCASDYFQRNSSQRSFQNSLSEQIPNNKFDNENWDFDTSLSRNSLRRSVDISERSFLPPLFNNAPEKPPRSAKNLKKIPVDSLLINTSQNKHYVDDSSWTYYSNNLRNSSIDEEGYSIPFDIKKDQFEEKFSSAVQELIMIEEPIYAKTTAKSSRDVEKMLFSAPPNIKINKTEHIYAQVTPRNSRSMDQYFTPNETLSNISDKINSSSEKKCFSSSQAAFVPDANSTIANEILFKESKETINMIHKINWSLNKEEVAHGHKCQHKNKKPEEQTLEEKFVVNMFQSRPSKRWEKHMRDVDQQRKSQDEKFDRSIWKRMSLDSRKQETKSLEANIKIISDNFDDVEKEIERLEIESKNLEAVSRKIERELKRMEQEDNDAFSKKLVKQKLQIEEHLNKFNNNVDETSIYLSNESRRIDSELEQIKTQTTEEYNKYKLLKKARDIECTRMTQASKALEEIKVRRGCKDWLEILIAERVLLETSERVNVLTQQIRDTTYTIIPELPLHKSTIHLSDIKFPFLKQFQGNCRRDKHYTEFFVMTLSYGSQIFVSEFITGESDPLIFSRNHTFKEVAPDFEIKVKLFCLRLRTSSGYFFERFTCYNLCPTSHIIYEDLLVNQFQEKTVFKTSFKLCAETTLSRKHIDEVSAKVNIKPEIFSKLDSQIEFNLKCDEIDIKTKLSGFLDVGQLCGEIYFWETKWCVLNGTDLMIYNYPQEEDLGRPFEQINLEYCFGPIITQVDNCPKRRSFHLKTGRPSDITNNNAEVAAVRTLKTKPNFTLRKFYFAASNMEEYIRWTVEVEKILNSLSDFKKLAFGEEYAVYLKQ